MPPAPSCSTQATGSWQKKQPKDQQLLWLWLSDWPGCCTPPSTHSGHLTLSKLTNAKHLGVPAEWCDPEGSMTLLHQVPRHIQNYRYYFNTFPPFLSVFQALDQLYSTCNLPHSNHHGANLMALAPGKACCNLCLITMFMWLDAVLQCAILKQVLDINVWFVTFSKEKIHSLH